MSEIFFYCGHSVAHEEDCPRCRIETLERRVADLVDALNDEREFNRQLKSMGDSKP